MGDSLIANKFTIVSKSMFSDWWPTKRYLTDIIPVSRHDCYTMRQYIASEKDISFIQCKSLKWGMIYTQSRVNNILKNVYIVHVLSLITFLKLYHLYKQHRSTEVHVVWNKSIHFLLTDLCFLLLPLLLLLTLDSNKLNNTHCQNYQPQYHFSKKIINVN
jgi:hypothetical protein